MGNIWFIIQTKDKQHNPKNIHIFDNICIALLKTIVKNILYRLILVTVLVAITVLCIYAIKKLPIHQENVSFCQSSL